MAIVRSVRPFLICLLFGGSAAAQDHTLPADSSASTPSVRWGFERVLNTFQWDAGAARSWSGPDLEVTIRQDLRSRFIRVAGTPRQDEYAGNVDVRARLDGPFSAAVRERSSVLSTPRSVEFSSVARHQLLAGPRWSPIPEVDLGVLAGWEWNRQQGTDAQGPAVGADLIVLPLPWEDLEVSGSGRWERTNLGDRRPEESDVSLRMERQFSQGVGDSILVRYRTQRRDLLTAGGPAGAVGGPASPSILRRDEREVSLRNGLWFGLGTSTSGTVEAGWTQRSIERAYSSSVVAAGPLPTVIEQAQLDLAARLNAQVGQAANSQLVLGLSSAEEAHDVRVDVGGSEADAAIQRSQARRRSNHTQRLFVASRSTAAASSVTDVTLEGSASIVRYDTPDTLNTDDRDELMVALGLGVSHRLSNALTVWAVLDAGLQHLVYLSRFQSANNYRLRTMRFAPGLQWTTPNGLWNVMRAEVAAAYTVYDFEDQVSTVQSYAFRQAAWSDSLTYDAGSSVVLEFYGSLRLFERGALRWRAFTERPERAFLETSWWPSMSVRPWPEASFSLGYRSFRQDRYRYDNGKRVYDGFLGSSGPTVAVRADFPRAHVQLTGWRESQRTSGGTVGSVPNLSLRVVTTL